MLTRFMQRAYSDMDGDEGVARRIAEEVEEAERNGSKHTVEMRYVRMPDFVVKAIDNATGEETLIKRSGSCMVMRSDDGSLSVMRRHVLSAEKGIPFDAMSELLGSRLSRNARDMMFADVYGTGKRVTYNIGVEEKRKLKDQIEEKEKQLDKVEGQLDELKSNPNNQVVTDLGIETDAGVKDKIDELTAKRDLLKAGIDGKKAMSIGDHHAMDKAVQDTFRANDRLDVIDRNKERLKNAAEKAKSGFDGGSGMDKYKGYGGKGVGNTKNAMQVRTESYVSDIGGEDNERLFASRYVGSRRFQYGTTLSKNSPAVSGRQGESKPQAPQNSQNSTQNDGKPLDVNDGKSGDAPQQPPPYNPSRKDGDAPQQPPPYSPSRKDGNGEAPQGNEDAKSTQSRTQYDYSADLKSVNDKMSGMEKQLGQLTEALKGLQSSQPQPTKSNEGAQQGSQGKQTGDEQKGDGSLAPSSSATPQPAQGSVPQAPPSTQQNGRRQVNWDTLSSSDPDGDAFNRELNKLTGGYLDKWDDEKGGFNDRGFWQMMQNKYGYQNPDVREHNQQRLEDSANLQAYRAQQMANEGKDFYGEMLEKRTANPMQDWQGTKEGVQDLNRLTYDYHAKMLGRNLGEDVKYNTDANGNTNYYYDQAVDSGRRLPGESDGDMLQRLRQQYGADVQMTMGANGKPQFSIRRSLGNGPSYISGANPLQAWASSQGLRAGRDLASMQQGFQQMQNGTQTLEDKTLELRGKIMQMPAVQRAVQAWNGTASNGGNFFQRLANAWKASR